MAKQAGISASTIEKWEKNNRPKPKDYPGRDDYMASVNWAIKFRERREARGLTRRKNKAIAKDPSEIDNEYNQNGERESCPTKRKKKGDK